MVWRLSQKTLGGKPGLISNPAGQIYDGILSSATLDKKKTHLSKGTVKIKENCSEHKATALFGGLDFENPSGRNLELFTQKPLMIS